MRCARYGSIARSVGLWGLSVCLVVAASGCTRPAPPVSLSGGATAGAGRGEGPRARLAPPPSLPGERLVARLCDLAGEAQLEQGERGLSQTLAALDTPYKLVSPYSGLRGEAALRVIEVAVAEPDVERYPAAPPPPRPDDKSAEAGAGSERPAGERTAPRFDPVWNRYRGVYESKLSLVSPPGSCYRFRLALPQQATLSLSAAVIPPQQGAKGGVPLDLTVRLDDQELWRERIGSGSPRLHRWLPLSLRLPPPSPTEAADGGGRDRRRELALCSQPAAAGQPAGTAVFGSPEIWAEGQGAAAPNLLLIIVDTLRADALGAMPRVSQYAARGARFSQAITAATWTRPALLALLGGDLPTAIGQNAEDMIPKERDRQRFYSLDRRLLPRVLRDAGLKVAAVGNNFFLLGYPQIGLSLGFDEVDDVRHPVLDSPAITRAAIQFLRKNQQRAFFLQLHYDAPHWPYSPPPEHLDKVSTDQAARLQAVLGEPDKAEPPAARRPADPQARAYLGEAAYADTQVAEVLAELSRLQLEQRTLVVILGDHGEIFDPKHSHFVQALKQPTMYHHGWAAYDEVLRVPLVMTMPGRLPAGAVVNEQVRLIDVAPTVLEALGLWDLRATLPGGLLAEGQSLVPLLQGEHEPERPAFAEGQNVRALRRGGYLYLRRPDPRLRAAPPNVTATTSSGIGPVRLVTEELYDLRRDPYQHHDLLAGPRSPAIERTLAEMRAEFTQRAPRPPEAKLPITHLALAPGGGARVLSGVLLSEDPQLSLLGVRNGEVTPQQPGRLEVVLRSGGQLDVQVDPAAKLTLVLTLDGLPLAREQLLIGPFGLPLLASGGSAAAGAPAVLPDLTALVAPRDPEGDEPPQIVLGGAMLARLTAAYPPVLGERGEVLVWRDQTSPGAAVTALSRPGATTQGEVATMMRDWGYAQPATSDAGSKPAAPQNPPAPPAAPSASTAPRPPAGPPPGAAAAPTTPPLLK
jgi:arylsulfatase A-like enzyme